MDGFDHGAIATSVSGQSGRSVRFAHPMFRATGLTPNHSSRSCAMSRTRSLAVAKPSFSGLFEGACMERQRFFAEVSNAQYFSGQR
jgi:hypothetical protein